MMLSAILKRAGFNNVVVCGDSRRVMEMVRKYQVELALLDLNMPNIGGEELLAEIGEAYPDIPVIIVTAAEEVETAVRCMKNGAFDYIVKPVNPERFITSAKRALEMRMLKREIRELKARIQTDALEHPEKFSDIITKNKQMLHLFKYAETVANTSDPLLITGETGTGKELMSECIHNLSRRRGRLVSLNVAGLDDHVFSDTLFGHVRGAFTGAQKHRPGQIELASNGTLFLDEIGDLSPPSQVKLLRLLQENEYTPIGYDGVKHSDARVVAATNKNLWELREDGQFREDLIYRLETFHIHLPPLRERYEDIPLLIEHFMEEAAGELKKDSPELPITVFSLLRAYPFRGNVRELRNMVYHVMSKIQPDDPPISLFRHYIDREKEKRNGLAEKTVASLFKSLSEIPTIKEATGALVDEAVSRARGRQASAAKMLGITPQALSKRLKKRAGS